MTAALASPLRAAVYAVSDEAGLRQAIDDANVDGDANSTITLNANITLSTTTAFTALTKPVMINTNGFTLSGPGGVMNTSPGGSLQFSGDTPTVSGAGTFSGGSAVAGTSNLAGGTALLMSGGSVVNGATVAGGSGGDNASGVGGVGGAGVSVTTGSVTNSGTISGGNAGHKTGGAVITSAAGGAGVSVTSGGLTNSGSMTGGRGGNNSNGTSGAGGAGAVVTGGSVVNDVSGTITGGTGGTKTGVAGFTERGGTGISVTNGSLTNDGTITGGIGGDNTSTTAAGGTGGIGAILTGGSHTNNGTIRGGQGGFSTFFGTTGGRGEGVQLDGASMVNNGLIEGGTVAGVRLRNAGSLTNSATGTVQGDDAGVIVGPGAGPYEITNSGTIEGVTRGIWVLGFGTGSPYNLTLVNSGTIQGATGVQFSTSAASVNVLELHAGSTILGNVNASPGANDTFRLGGATNASFDVSTIGAAAQYRDFDIFEKNGASTWTLTGTTATVTPWRLLGGTLSVSSDGNLGGAAGGLTFNGGTLRTTADLTSSRTATLTGAGTLSPDAGTTLTLDGVISGAGGLTKDGAGTAVLTATNTYMGGTTINAGTLSVSGDANLGDIAGGITFDGGTLRTTATMSSVRTVSLAGSGAFLSDASTTLTLSGTISGTGGLTKAGDGTLVLSGVNTYGGGTSINGGTLQVSDDDNLGGAAGGLTFNGGTLQTTATMASPRDITLAGTGTLLTDVGTTLTLNGTVSGAGGLTKSGAGTLVFTGDNSAFAGTTTVSGGTLRVNGSLGDATSTLSVLSGGTLGGSGTVGGDVDVANGGTLAPGNSPDTLTIDGDLSLTGGAVLDFEFGQANVGGGPLNDLVDVGGDLVLDGTLDVTVSAGGSFGPGVYRMFNYGGTLTNNALELGSVPIGNTLFVQTSVANRVNLINTTGLTLSFWDGGAGTTKNDGAIQGGDGVWQSGTGNDSWTEIAGDVNAPYADAAFATFAGTTAGGTVTIDNSLGDVRAAGLQFATDGYTIAGDALTLVGGPQSTVRVGDGTAAGAGYTATIATDLAGTTQLVKTDLGTLVLSGTNSYTGGTAIDGGVLRVSRDANLGDAAGGVRIDGGTLQTTADMTSDRDVALANTSGIRTDADTAFTLTGSFAGSGTFNKDGDGRLVLAGDSSGYAGATHVLAGTLAVNNALGGTVDIRGGRLGGVGSVGNIANYTGGTVAPGNSIGTLTINGDYAGDGGTLEVEAEVAGDDSPADLLVVTGDTAGTTFVSVVNRGGPGAQTENGIKIVDVAGASDGTFTLNGDYVFEGQPAVIAGAYGYRLHKNGLADPADGDWYLRSTLVDGAGGSETPDAPLFQPGVPVYETYPQTMLALNGLPTLRERVGVRQWTQSMPGGAFDIWSRVEGSSFRPDARHSTSRADTDVDSWKLQVGVDRVLRQWGDGTSLVAGITAHYGEANGGVSSPFGNGGVDTEGYGLGATLTWYGPGGFYADAQAQASWYDSDLDSSTLGTLTEGNDGQGEAFSLEAGKHVPLRGGLAVTPQAQVVYSNVDFDRFVDPFDALVSADGGDSLRSRLGLTIDYQGERDGGGAGGPRGRLYALVNLTYEWLDGTRTEVSGTRIANENERLWVELGLGGSFILSDRLSLYGQASANTPFADFGDSYGFKGLIGLRLEF